MSIDPTELQNRLAKLDNDFASAPADPGSFDNLPEPGEYQALLRSVDFFEAKGSEKTPAGTPFLKLVFEIDLDPRYAGWEVEMIHNLDPQGTPEERQRKLGFLKRDLTRLGIDTENSAFSLGLLYPGSSIWDDIMDVPVVLAVVESKKTNPNTGRPYKNVYLNERIGDPMPGHRTGAGSDIPTQAPVASVPTGDDLPDF